MKWIAPIALTLLLPVSPVLGGIGFVWLWLAGYNAYLNKVWGQN